MKRPKMRATRHEEIKVVHALDATMTFLIVTFNENARVVFGPALATPANKERAVKALQAVYANGGTRMGTALNAMVEQLGKDQARATKILFLTDGKNEGERRNVLDQAVDRCTGASIN